MDTISIAKFKQEGLKAATCFRNDMIVTNHIENMEQFKYPCRIDAITILICTRGSIHININLKEYEVKENSVMVSFPENIIQMHEALNFEAYAMLVSSSYMRNLQIDLKQKLDSHMSLKASPLTYVSYDEIFMQKYFYFLLKDNMKENSDNSSAIIRGLSSAFVYKIISIINSYRPTLQESCSTCKTRTQLTFERFMTLLSVYHEHERCLKFYADKMNITSNYLSGIVKEYSGKTAVQWIEEYVILEAKTLLRYSGMTVQQVAYRLNFPTQSSFGRYFKSQSGMSPKSYMKS